MITITVEITHDCESIITNMPRGYEYELIDEEYTEDGGTVTITVHDVDDITSGMAQALDTHDGVISYTVS
jgi:zona occludens toxin (predicted ATPase)